MGTFFSFVMVFGINVSLIGFKIGGVLVVFVNEFMLFLLVRWLKSGKVYVVIGIFGGCNVGGSVVASCRVFVCRIIDLIECNICVSVFWGIVVFFGGLLLFVFFVLMYKLV